MPRKVSVKSTERKAELDEIKEKRASKKREHDDDDAKVASKNEPDKKKIKKNPIKLGWNDKRPIVKMLAQPLAVPNVTETAFPDLSQLKKQLTLGKMRGKDLDTKEHISIPLYYLPDPKNPHLAQRIRFGIRGKHPVGEPTQYEGASTTPKKAASKKDKKDPKLSPWTLNVPVLPSNKRDDFICKAVKEIFDFCVEELDSDEFWEAIGRPHLKPNNIADGFRTPILDLPEGSFFKIKFVYNIFTKSRRFELYDFRDSGADKKNSGKKTDDKKPTPQALPQTIKDGNDIDGTFDVDDIYVRPADQSFGFSFIWSAARVHNGTALKVQDDQLVFSMSVRAVVFVVDAWLFLLFFVPCRTG